MIFAELLESLELTNKTSEKKELIQSFLRKATPQEAIHGVYLLSGRSAKRLASSTAIKKVVREQTGVDKWLFKQCYAAVGDLAETTALLLPRKDVSNKPLHTWFKDLQRLRKAKDYQKPLILKQILREASPTDTFIICKLLTGSLRVGVSKGLTVQAVSDAFSVDKHMVEQHLMGDWSPTSDILNNIKEGEVSDKTKPYPFFLATQFTSSDELGDISDYVFEYKYDGIRSQVITTDSKTRIWSRKGKLVNDSFPDIRRQGKDIDVPDVVLDGELIAYDDAPLPFNTLQERLGQLNPSAELRRRVPVHFIAYDVLRLRGEDLRGKPLNQRRALLESLDLPHLFHVASTLSFESWAAAEKHRATLRNLQTEGLMIKRKSSPYRSGRVRGDWWKWKVDPLTIDAVMMYAFTGKGRRAGKYTDYTFGIHKGADIVPIAKAYSGVSEEEIEELDAWIRENTEEKYGPVRKVRAERVVELAFDGIHQNNRKKAGFSLRFPRIKRLRDKPVSEIDSVDSVRRIFESISREPAESLNNSTRSTLLDERGQP